MALFPLIISPPPVLAPLVGSTSPYRHHAIPTRQPPNSRPRCKRVCATYLVMIDEVGPWNDLCHQGRISAVSRRHTLHVGRQAAVAVQWLALLDFVHHFPHVHLNFSVVLCPAVESYCSEDRISYLSFVERQTPKELGWAPVTYNNFFPRPSKPRQSSPSHMII